MHYSYHACLSSLTAFGDKTCDLMFKCRNLWRCFPPKNSWRIHLKEWNNNDNLLGFFFFFFFLLKFCLSEHIFVHSFKRTVQKILWIAFPFFVSYTQFKVNLLMIQEWGDTCTYPFLAESKEKKVLITLLLADVHLKQYVVLICFVLAAVIKHFLLSYAYAYAYIPHSWNCFN